jgi:NDP-sugar pyrophosphorylase family protein
MNVVIPMAGIGSRFSQAGYSFPKPLIDVNGKPMIVRAVDSLGFNANWFFLIRKDEYSEIIKSVISELLENVTFVTVEKTTEGPACSVLLFEEQINNDDELIVANCDQIMEWNSELFFHNVRLYDGAVVTYHNDTDKNSYAKIDSKGLVTELREKEVISNISLNGIHYWKHGKYFVDSAKAMISENDRAPNGEFYIAPSYNYMIRRGLTVGIYHIPNQQHHAVGVPIDLEKFIQYDKAKNRRIP